jgi:hypothetical protein
VQWPFPEHLPEVETEVQHVRAFAPTVYPIQVCILKQMTYIVGTNELPDGFTLLVRNHSINSAPTKCLDFILETERLDPKFYVREFDEVTILMALTDTRMLAIWDIKNRVLLHSTRNAKI